MDSEDDVDYTSMVRLEVVLAHPALVTNILNNTMIDEPLENSSSDED